ncbi:MAG: helix-turn-helix domain-containing protein [Pirellulales bacterium]|nr:helix-turn-helix domain-containing protein [Pirellulales bacterium]
MNTSSSPANVTQMLENCLGCKWTMHVLEQIRQGIRRPGQLERTAVGLTTKVLGERLEKLRRYSLIEKTDYDESPPRVEYHLTPFGQKCVEILDQFQALQVAYKPTG